MFPSILHHKVLNGDFLDEVTHSVSGCQRQSWLVTDIHPRPPAQSWIAARENKMILLLQVCSVHSDCLCFAIEETQGGAVPVVANVE